MNINNNYNNFNAPSFEANKDNFSMLDKEKKTDSLLEKGRSILYKRAEREVPENGKFRKIFVAFDIPETQNEALISIEHDAVSPEVNRRLSVGVHRQNSDRITSNYLFKGTKREVLDYINNKDNQAELHKTINNLSKSVDDYYSSL